MYNLFEVKLMNNQVLQDITLYCDSFLELKKPLYWKTSSYYVKLCALAYAFEGNRPDSQSLLEAIDYIKKNTGILSYLRSSRVYSAAYLTAGRKSIETEFNKLALCFDVMKEAGFKSSNYLPIAAHALYSTTAPGTERKKAETALCIYKEMKKSHPFLTSTDDYASAVILASVDHPINEMMNEIEKTYELLRDAGLQTGNGLQFLSQILVFDPSAPEDKVLRCRLIAEKLKNYKNRVTSMYYGTIGFLALTGDQWEKAIDETLEVLSFMKENKCYSLGEREFHLMIAGALVSKSYVSEKGTPDATLLRIGLGATVEAIIAAQAAACAAGAAAAAAAASSSSS